MTDATMGKIIIIILVSTVGICVVFGTCICCTMAVLKFVLRKEHEARSWNCINTRVGGITGDHGNYNGNANHMSSIVGANSHVHHKHNDDHDNGQENCNINVKDASQNGKVEQQLVDSNPC